MKIKAEQLARTLTHNLKSQPRPLIWLSGDEPLLLQESADQIRHHYREQGFIEREIFSVDKGFHWDEFLQASGNLSLFAARKILELRLASSKLEDAGKEALARYLEEPAPDLLILISSPRLEKATQNTKWFKRIEAAAVVVQIWPVDRDSLGAWLEQRLLREGIRADAEALALLTDKIEGNLLAAMQEIAKLKLLATPTDGAPITLDARTVMQVVADNSRYSTQQLVDAALAGDLARAQKILGGLKAEGVFPLAVLGAIVGELRRLLPMLEKKALGQGINAIIQSSHVFWSRKQVVGNALQRLHARQVWQFLEQARIVDQSVKGMHAGDSWEELSRLLTLLAGRETATTSLPA